MKKCMAIFLSLVMTLGLLAGCGGEQAPETAPETEETQQAETEETQDAQGEEDAAAEGLEKVVIVEPVRGYHWAQAYLAETLGYFEEEGLDVEFQTIRGSDPATALMTGDAQFCLKGIETPLMMAEKGKQTKALVAFTQGYPYQLISAGPDYPDMESLRGAVVAGGRSENSGPSTFGRACLNDAGLVPGTDVTYMGMFSDSYPSALEKGDIQAAVGTNPWSAKQLRDRGGVVLVDGTDKEVMKKLTGSETAELFILMATDEYINANPETTQKVVNGVVKAMKWMESATPEDIAKQLLPLFEGAEEELLYDAQVDKDSGIASYTGYHTQSGYASAVEMLKMAGGITTDIPEEDIYNETFLDKAWETVGK